MACSGMRGVPTEARLSLERFAATTLLLVGSTLVIVLIPPTGLWALWMGIGGDSGWGSDPPISAVLMAILIVLLPIALFVGLVLAWGTRKSWSASTRILCLAALLVYCAVLVRLVEFMAETTN